MAHINLLSAGRGKWAVAHNSNSLHSCWPREVLPLELLAPQYWTLPVPTLCLQAHSVTRLLPNGSLGIKTREKTLDKHTPMDLAWPGLLGSLTVAYKNSKQKLSVWIAADVQSATWQLTGLSCPSCIIFCVGRLPGFGRSLGIAESVPLKESVYIGLRW